MKKFYVTILAAVAALFVYALELAFPVAVRAGILVFLTPVVLPASHPTFLQALALVFFLNVIGVSFQTKTIDASRVTYTPSKDSAK